MTILDLHLLKLIQLELRVNVLRIQLLCEFRFGMVAVAFPCLSQLNLIQIKSNVDVGGSLVAIAQLDWETSPIVLTPSHIVS